MKRVLGVALGLVALVAGAFAVAGAGAEEGDRYKIVFDNASGLVEQADFRVGGVAVGAIESFDVAPGARALVTVSVSDPGFGGLRSDAECEIRQQSLIGEYFVECEPGTSGDVLADGATIPVKQTRSPIAPDLVQNIMRRPYRERFSILLSELGAGFAARGEDVNATIRRALPALQETNRVLKILGDNRRTLRQLTADSGVILDKLGDRRRDVGRFVVEARDAAAATAERRDALAATFRRFPGFLREFTPTMVDLGTAASELAPALADLRAAAPSVERLLKTRGPVLRAAAPSVERLLNTLGPFARASEPAVESLGDASRAGRETAREATPTVRALGELGSRSGEPAKNLAFILRHLDDRDFAVEPDPDSPGGKGYTGFEALLQYPFDQSLAINIFDTRGYILKLNALINECSAYTDAEEAREEPERTKRCSQALGPNQPGVNQPDPTASGQPSRRSSRTRSDRDRRPDERRDETAPQADRRPDATPSPSPTATPGTPGLPKLPELLDRLPDLLDGKGLAPQQRPSQRPSQRPPADLLDFLLAP